LQVYLLVTEKTAVRELVEILTKDLEIQFERRLALLKEAVEDNSKNLSS
jgi:ribosomal protein S17E